MHISFQYYFVCKKTQHRVKYTRGNLYSFLKVVNFNFMEMYEALKNPQKANTFSSTENDKCECNFFR